MGHDAVHVADLGLEAAPDEQILGAAADQNRVIISADTDFGTLLATTHASLPSMILIRRLSHRRLDGLAALLLANLGDLTEHLAQGAVVVIEETRMRIRSLPLP